ncbi:MAG: 3-isopropylmalate dehydratase small subunit [Bacilli bacterium]|nr:3-isopropylmalate dehydratase small subunit [Bacilli bacterium]
MKPINKITSVITPLDRKNVDTDQIISKEFLKRIERTGFGQYLFHHWRFHSDGTPVENFVLNNPRFEESEILVAQENFGCGSSREHAQWALQDYGFNVVIAPSYADIFYNNCVKNGILPIRLQDHEVNELIEKGKEAEFKLEVNLEQQSVKGQDGTRYEFTIDPYWKEMLLKGWDEIELTFQHESHITAYEEKRRLA